VAEDLHALDEKIKSMMEIGENKNADTKATAWTCKVCGKEDKYSINIKRHHSLESPTSVTSVENYPQQELD